MDILFLLVGISLYLAAAAVFAIDYAKQNPPKAAASFVFPPYAWLLYWQNKNTSQKIVYTQIVAFALFLGGFFMVQLFDVQRKIFSQAAYSQQDSFEYVASRDALQDLAHAEKRSSQLNGKIRGRDFIFNNAVDSAEFDADGTLRIKKGSDFYGAVEIAIELGEIPPRSKDPVRRLVMAKDDNAPSIYVFWLDEKTIKPNVLRFDRGYQMDISFEHQSDNVYLAKLQLVLPDLHKTFLAGDFTVYGSHLRFVEQVIDRQHDSIQTLEFIAADNLLNTQRRFVRDIYGFERSGFDYRTGEGLGYSQVYLAMQNGSNMALPLHFFKNDNGWFMDVKDIQDQLRDGAYLVSRIPERLTPPPRIRTSMTGTAESDLQVTTREDATRQDAEATREASRQTMRKKTVAATGEVQERTVDTKAIEARKVVASVAVAEMEIEIDVRLRADEIPEILRVYINSEIEVQTRAGRMNKGIYTGIVRRQVAVEAEVGSGIVEYLTAYDNLSRIRVMNAPQLRPQTINFIYSEP